MLERLGRMGMGKKDVFRELLWENKWLGMAAVGLAYVRMQVLVTGNGRLSKEIDRMLEGDGGSVLDGGFLLWLGGLIVLGFGAAYFMGKCTGYFAVRMQTQLRERTGRKLPGLEYVFFDESNSASVMNKLISDIGTVSLYYSETLPEILMTVVTAVVVLGSMWRMDWKLIVFFLIIFPPVLLLSNYAGRKIAGLQKKHWQLWDEVSEIAYDNVQGIVVGRSYNLFPLMKGRVEDANRRLLEFEFARNRLSMIPWLLNAAVNWMPHLTLGILVLYRVLAGELSVGEMTYFILMMDRVVHPLSSLPEYLLAAKNAYVSKERLAELVERPLEWSGEDAGGIREEAGAYGTEDAGGIREEAGVYGMEDAGGTREDAGVYGTEDAGGIREGSEGEGSVAVEFKDVVFGYDGTREVLKGVSFRIREGEKVAFVGESGEGKSTIFRLLCGFYRQQGGEVRFYGKFLGQWGIDGVRERIAIVSQNVYLFPETVAWNIACGREDCSREDIEEACKKANIHEFIMSLPDGYETLVGERGDTFSGGQKQRISIARAFLKDAPVLLLDEPTSAVDMETERLLKEAIQRISKGRTVMTIAHRLSTVEDADCIYALSGGRIAEWGTQEELLGKKGVYYRLYEGQRAERATG